MKPTSIQLKQKALGFVLAIEKMPQQAKQRNPSGLYGKDYNGLVEMVREISSDLDAVLPPEVEFFEDERGRHARFCVQKYDEISEYCQQIIQVLSLKS